MGNTKIEWAEKVWNPVTGCTKISQGCANCYAERMSKRFGETWGLPVGDPFKVTMHPDRLEQPLRWNKPSKVFVCSMSDLFHDDVPDDFIMKTFEIMANAQWTNGHRLLVLTKRPERMAKIIKAIEEDILEQRKPIKNSDGTTTHRMTFNFPLQNVWLGVTAENQEQADKRMPILLQILAAKRFVSVEPMLGNVDLRTFSTDGGAYYPLDGDVGVEGRGHCKGPKLDWVICGGESGPGARPMHPDWVRSLRDQCQASGTPFLFKQWGEWAIADIGNVDIAKKHFLISRQGKDETEKPIDQYSEGTKHMVFVGKKKAGRLLDGRVWDEYPATTKEG
jgi:protein gp37